MKFVDYYKVLGVEKTATDKQIKSAYRKLARKYHPDVNPNDKQAEENFKQLNEANKVLSNPDNRKKYDKFGENWQHAEAYEEAAKKGRSSSQQQTRGGGFQGEFNESDYASFFESMFGAEQGRGRGNVKFKGHDFKAELHLTLRQAFITHKQTLSVNGKDIRISVPAGIENGQTIKIKGHGGKGENGGPNGDLYITFVIERDATFRRDGDNLYRTSEIDLFAALLGGETTIETFDSKVKIKIKPSTQPGTLVKLKGKGFPKYKKEGVFGDLYVTLNVLLPENITDAEKELIKQLSELRK